MIILMLFMDATLAGFDFHRPSVRCLIQFGLDGRRTSHMRLPRADQYGLSSSERRLQEVGLTERGYLDM